MRQKNGKIYKRGATGGWCFDSSRKRVKSVRLS
jgi:hypothetical protein